MKTNRNDKGIHRRVSRLGTWISGAAAAVLMGAGPVSAETVYIGGNLTTDSFGEIGEPVGGPSGGASVQWLLLSSETTPLGNNSITGIAFRLDADYAPQLPVFGYQNLKITLGYTTATDLNGFSTIAGNNAAATNLTVVYDGSFYYSADAFPTGATDGDANGFGAFIKFTTPFLNDTSKNLIFTIQHTLPIDESGNELSVSYFSADGGSTGRTVLVGDYEATSTFGYSITPVSAFTTDSVPDNYSVPEPTTVGLIGLALGGAALLYRRKQSLQA